MCRLGKVGGIVREGGAWAIYRVGKNGTDSEGGGTPARERDSVSGEKAVENDAENLEVSGQRMDMN